MKLTPEGWPMWDRQHSITDDAEAEAMQIVLAAYESGAETLPPGSALRAHFLREATVLRTQLAASEENRKPSENPDRA